MAMWGMRGANTCIDRRSTENCLRSPTCVGVMKQIDSTLVVLMLSRWAPAGGRYVRPQRYVLSSLHGPHRKIHGCAAIVCCEPRSYQSVTCLRDLVTIRPVSAQLAVLAAAAVVAAELPSFAVVGFLAGNAEAHARDGVTAGFRNGRPTALA